jgi:hypothetical protein
MNPQKHYKYIFVVGLFFSIAILVLPFFSHTYRFDGRPDGQLLRDFTDFWGGPRLYWSGNIPTIFNPPAFDRWLKLTVYPGSFETFSTWSYPPTMLVLLLPFGLIPALPSLFIWIILNFILLGIALVNIKKSMRFFLIILLSPAALYSLLVMQNGPLLSSLFITGLWFVETRPILAGLCFGLLGVKPQLSILVPVILVAGRHWRSLSTAALTLLAIVLASVMLFGIQPWTDFFSKTLPLMQTQLYQPYPIKPQYAMPTIFIMIRSMRANSGTAMALQAVGTVCMMALVGYLWSDNRKARNWRNALTCLAVPLATPFAYVYDIIPVMFAIAIIASTETEVYPVSLTLAAAAVWIWPSFGVFWTALLNLPEFGALAILLLVVLAFRAARPMTETLTLPNCLWPAISQCHTAPPV